MHETENPFTLDACVETPTPRPVRAIVYGTHGVGKTTFGAHWPGVRALFVEDGRRSIRIRHFPALATSYQDVVAAMMATLSAPEQTGTFMLDSLDWLEPLIWAETCARNSLGHIEEPGYGKGYVLADDVWKELFRGFDALRDAGMHVLLLAHAEAVTFNPPESDAYTRHDLALHKRARAIAHEWADLVGFAYEKTNVKQRTEGTGKSAKTITKGGATLGRFLALERKSTHEAKNGFGLPAEIPFTQDATTATQLLDLIMQSYTHA